MRLASGAARTTRAPAAAQARAIDSAWAASGRPISSTRRPRQSGGGPPRRGGHLLGLAADLLPRHLAAPHAALHGAERVDDRVDAVPLDRAEAQRHDPD